MFIFQIDVFRVSQNAVEELLKLMYYHDRACEQELAYAAPSDFPFEFNCKC